MDQHWISENFFGMDGIMNFSEWHRSLGLSKVDCSIRAIKFPRGDSNALDHRRRRSVFAISIPQLGEGSNIDFVSWTQKLTFTRNAPRRTHRRGTMLRSKSAVHERSKSVT